MLDFDDLETKYGPALAHYVLMEIERVAQISSLEMIDIDPKARLAHALRVQDGFGALAA